MAGNGFSSAVDDAEDRRVQPDAEPETEHRDDGKPLVCHRRAGRIGHLGKAQA
jgi:hypothetical protein